MAGALARAQPARAPAALPGPGAASAGELTIGGAGSVLGVMGRLAEGFRRTNPDIRIRILPTLDSHGGVRAMLDGQLALAVTSRAPEPDERAQGAVGVEFARTAFVLAVGRGTPIDDVTLDDLAAILSGRRTAWADGTPIRPVLRPMTDNDSKTVVRMGPQLAAALQAAHQATRPNIVHDSTEAADRIERVPGAIGASSLALLLSEERRMKALSIAGVAPTLANLANGRYPYVRSMHLVHGANASPAALAFVRFVTSPAGSAILRSVGGLPVAERGAT